jgi:hypothetical protein
MRCYSDLELVQAELGKLSTNQVKKLDDHSAVCSRCVQARQAIRQLTEDLAPRPDQEDDFVERVVAARKVATPVAPARRR